MEIVPEAFSRVSTFVAGLGYIANPLEAAIVTSTRSESGARYPKYSSSKLLLVAVFDTIVLISFNIYSFYFYILHDPNPFVGQSQFWPRFAIFHSNIGLTAHSIALWLTCLLAIVSSFY